MAVAILTDAPVITHRVGCNSVYSWDDRMARLKARVHFARRRHDAVELLFLERMFAMLCDELTVETLPIAEALDALSVAADQLYAEAREEQREVFDTAWNWLLAQEAIQVDPHGALLVQSAHNAHRVFRAGPTCQCEAFVSSRFPIVCEHRAAALTVQRYLAEFSA